jgi:hypothetical protein
MIVIVWEIVSPCARVRCSGLNTIMDVEYYIRVCKNDHTGSTPLLLHNEVWLPMGYSLGPAPSSKDH